MGSTHPGRDGPDQHEEPPEIGTHDAAPQANTKGKPSGPLDNSETAGSAQSGSDRCSTRSLHEFDGQTVEGCVLESSDPVGLFEGSTVLDTGWHICDGITIRVVFTAKQPNPPHRQWMEDLLFQSSSVHPVDEQAG